VKKRVIFGWVVSCIGSLLWIYGYYANGHPPIFDWQARTPWWIADFLPNIESEIGMILVFASMIPMYWPSRR
jgi:hypothetical protein